MKHLSDAEKNLAGTDLSRVLGWYLDPQWYLERYPDVAATGFEPLWHFIHFGAAEGRDANRFFDGEWYRSQYPDVSAGELFPLLHYLLGGAAEGRNPHPRFDAAYYIREHPEASGNPLLYHLRVGQARGYPTEKPFEIKEYLPSEAPPTALPPDVTVDVVIPVSRGLDGTRRCLLSVLADRSRPLGQIIVVEDRSPEPDLVAWLQTLADTQQIILLRNKRKLGFAGSANRGMEEAGEADIVLLSSDTEVPAGWLRRLAAQAHAASRIASVSPFSSNAMICGYSGGDGWPLAFGHTLAEIDEACRTVNNARFVDVPSTASCCMYIRGAALRAVGRFDAERFTQGGGAQGQFCLRASAAGWTHRLACDTFVCHIGQVNCDDRNDKRTHDRVLEQFPDYEQQIARHAGRGAATPFRFALTAALFRLSKLPVILMVTHDMGGGVRRHIDSLVARYHDRARFVLMEGTARETTLLVPGLPGHPKMTLPADRSSDLLLLLRSMNVGRVHLHHLMGIGLDVRDLIRQLGVPFDVTLHDYYALCPQRNLLPWEERIYCGEPGPAVCNACIEDSGDLDRGARDILSWRLERAWQFIEANRVICPSGDVMRRLERYGLAERALVMPHQDQPLGDWPVTLPALSGPTLRVALLGVLANLKGGRTVAALAAAAPPESLAINLIGFTDQNFPPWALKLITQSGEYREADLAELIPRAKPHVLWFPSTAPETYSYTLTAAIETGLPIVATNLGAFPERLAGRPLTWLVDHRASTSDLLAVFEQVRQTLRHPPPICSVPRPVVTSDFYAQRYLSPAEVPKAERPRAARRNIVALVEHQADGSIGHDAYLRLLQPLDHPAIGRDYRLILANSGTFTSQPADAIIAQPGAIPDLTAAETILDHVRRSGSKFVIDLNADPLALDGWATEARMPVLRRLLGSADSVWVATPELGRRIAPLRPDAVIMQSRLDERLWLPPAAQPERWDDPVRILCIRTGVADEDFALIEPALVRLKESYAERVSINILRLSGQDALPLGLDLLRAPTIAAGAYPSFVHWIRSVPTAWHIGLAPLADTAANRCKGPVRAMEYAALGIPVLASDVPAFRGSLADGRAGQLVVNTPAAWYAALDWMVRNQAFRQELTARARAVFDAEATLAGAAEVRRAALRHLLTPEDGTVTALRRRPRELHSRDEPSDTASRKRRRCGRG